MTIKKHITLALFWFCLAFRQQLVWQHNVDANAPLGFQTIGIIAGICFVVMFYINGTFCRLPVRWIAFLIVTAPALGPIVSIFRIPGSIAWLLPLIYLFLMDRKNTPTICTA